MMNVSFAGKIFDIPNYADTSINFSDVYQKLRSWHIQVKPIFDETVKDIGSTIDDVRIATKQLEANAGRLNQDELEVFAKQCRLFTESFKRFKDTQTHAHLLLKNLDEGITFLNRPGLTKTDIVTLEHLDPQRKEQIEQLQLTCNKYLEDLRKIQSSVTANCQHFDKRVGDLSRPLDYHLKAVESKGQLGYISWGWTHIKHIFFNPSIDTVATSAFNYDEECTPSQSEPLMENIIEALQSLDATSSEPKAEDLDTTLLETPILNTPEEMPKTEEKAQDSTTGMLQMPTIIEQHMTPKTVVEQRETITFSQDSSGLTRRQKKSGKTPTIR
jgi:hypothetical protein